jgi:hypothetical protein
VAARTTLALGHLGHQEDRLEPDRHGLQLPEAPPLAADLLALALRTHQLLGFDRQEKPHTALAIFGLPILIAFPHSERMKQQALTHASGAWLKSSPDSNLTEEPKICVRSVRSGQFLAFGNQPKLEIFDDE